MVCHYVIVRQRGPARRGHGLKKHMPERISERMWVRRRNQDSVLSIKDDFGRSSG